MKRHMKVSAELASMTSLSVSWHGSVLIRSDEASMDLMRAAVVGPPDTPYANGFWLFDILLLPEYPDVPPKVLFLTTGGNQVRVNPNLYAEGKVCLSLLGTWSGPGWSPGISTLGQVLMSIQSQIMVDIPFANEPGHESRISTPGGKRSVAKHNIAIRLATLRHAILSPLKSPPHGFEVAVKAHFFYKRDTLFGQFDVWKKDARDFAAYEEYLFRRCEELCAVIEVLQDYEQAQANIRADEAQAQSLSQAQVFQQSQGIVSSPLIAASRPSKKAIKRASAQTGTFPLGVASPAVPSSFSKALPTTSANPSPQLRSLQQEFIRYNSAYVAWLTDTSTPSHIVFNSGLGAIGAPTKASLTTYIDGLLDASDIQALTHGAASFVAAAIRTSVDAVLTSAKEKIQCAKLIGSSMVTTSSSSAGAAGASFSFQAPIMIGSVNLRSLISAKTNAARSQGAFDLAAATIDAIDSVESRLKTLTESDLL
jgi:ubiquitin-protein ligase